MPDDKKKPILTLKKNPQVRKFVIRREVQPKGEGKKPYTKAPRIQRLVTPQRLQHKRHRMALKKRRSEASKDAAVRRSLPPPSSPHFFPSNPHPQKKPLH